MADSRSSPPQVVQFYRLPGRARAAAVAHPSSQGRDCVVALKALAEDTRVRIIEAPLDVTRIAERVGVSQYNVAKHLRILREAGLVEVEKNGRRRLYGLSESVRRQADAAPSIWGAAAFSSIAREKGRAGRPLPASADPGPSRPRGAPGADAQRDDAPAGAASA